MRSSLDRFVAISDIHFNLQNLHVAKRVLAQAMDLAIHKGCPLFVGGDANDTKAILRSETVESIISLFEERDGLESWWLIGNHDLNHHNSDKHSLNFLRYLKNVTVVSAPMVYCGWGLIPYIHSKDEFSKATEHVYSLGARRLLIHQGVKGALMSEYAFDESSVSLDFFDRFDLVLSGHYHMHQWLGEKFMYWGSPYTTRFDECDQEKFIYYVDATGEKVSIEKFTTDARRHFQFEVDSMDKVEALPKLRPDSLVKVVVVGDKQFIASVSKNILRDRLGVENVSIVPSISRTLTYRMDVNAASDPKKVVLDFLSKSDTSMDKSRLEAYIKRKMV